MTIAAKDSDVSALLKECETLTSKRFVHKLIDQKGNIIPGTMILIDGINIHHLGGTTADVRDGAVVSVFPPGGGG